MKEQYKKGIDQIHAPEELIRSTQSIIYEKKRKRVLILAYQYVAAAAMICVLLTAGMILRVGYLTDFTKVLEMEQMPKLMLGIRNPQQRAATEEEFDEAFGTSFADLLVDEVQAYLIRTVDEQPESGRIMFRWNTGSTYLQVQCMVNMDTENFSELLYTAKKQYLQGMEVSFIQMESVYYAVVFGDEKTMLVSQEEIDGSLISRYAFRQSVSALVERLENK